MGKDTSLQPLIDEVHQLRLSIESNGETRRQLEDIRRTLGDIEQQIQQSGGGSD